MSADLDSTLLHLKRRWGFLALASAISLLALSVSLRLPPGWLLFAGLALAYLLLALWRGLPLNHRPDDPTLLPDLGLPNLVTFWRGVLLAGAAGFLFQPRPGGDLLWLPGVLFSAGVLPDYLDGYLARRTNRISLLGAALDVQVDYIAFLAGSLLIVQYGQAPLWFLLVPLARYLFVGGLWLRTRLGKPNHPLPPSLARSALSGMQMGFIMVMVWPLFAPPATQIAAALFAAPFLLNFGRDWLFASGVLRADPTRPAPALPVPGWVTRWLPLGMRLLVALSLGLDLSVRAANLSGYIDFYTVAGVVNPALLVGLLFGMQGVTAAGLALGVTARTLAVLALGLSGLYLRLGEPFSLEIAVRLVSAAGVFFLGSGAFSLWSPEAELLRRRAGEASG